MTFQAPAAPVAIPEAFADAQRIVDLVHGGGPYWNQARYAGDAGSASVLRSGLPASAGTGAPVFRADWAAGRPLVPGAELVLDNERCADAARQLFGAEVVRPQLVYVNVNPPLPQIDPGHVDVPTFRGVDRGAHPVALLHLMGRSRLFEHWRVQVATAVAWFYDGPGGEFVYWPDGPDQPPIQIDGPLTNLAIMGDNDFMFHRVAALGEPGATLEAVPLSMESEIRFDPAADAWKAYEGDMVAAAWPAEQVRVSISWKAYVFADANEARRADEHIDDLTPAMVVERFVTAAADRHVVLPAPDDPDDPAFLAALSDLYPRRKPVPA